MDYYNTIEKMGVAEFKDRGSRFLAYAFPLKTVGDFKLRLNELKKEHPKAVHHCFGYRIGRSGDVFRVSDDGEPSGTAGKPILGQIDSKGLTDCAVIVVRYFGGTLLGVPGLINAYKTVTSLVLQTIPVVQKSVEDQYRLTFPYEDINLVMKVIKQNNCTILEQDMGLFPMIKLGVPRVRLRDVELKLGEIRNVSLEKIL